MNNMAKVHGAVQLVYIVQILFYRTEDCHHRTSKHMWSSYSIENNLTPRFLPVQHFLLCDVTLFIPHEKSPSLKAALRVSFLWLLCFMIVFICSGFVMRPQRSPCTSLYMREYTKEEQTLCHPNSPSKQLLLHFQMFPVLVSSQPEKNMK